MHNQVPWAPIRGTNHYMSHNVSSERPRTMSSAHPPALFPARRPSTVHSTDLFFVAPAAPPPPLPPVPPPPSRHSRPTTAPNGPHPPTHPLRTDHLAFHRSYTCPPPIPPKPSELQSMKPGPQPAPPVAPPEPPPEVVKEISSEDEFALALEISRSVSKKQRSIVSQEDEDLARALEESLKESLKLAETNGTLTPPLHISGLSGERQTTDISSVSHVFDNGNEETPVQSPSTDPIPSPQTPISSNTRPTLGSNDNGSGVASGSDSISTPIGRSFIDFGDPSDRYAKDEALARSLADYPVNPCADDEILARRLAQEEGIAPESSTNSDVAKMRRNDAPSWSSRQNNQQPGTTSASATESEARRTIIRGQDASIRGRSKSAMATLNTTRPPDIQDLPPPYEAPKPTSSTERSSTTLAVSNPRQPSATEYGSSLDRPPIPRVNSFPIVTIPQSNVSGPSQPLSNSPTASTSQSSLSSSPHHTLPATRNTQVTSLPEEVDYDASSANKAGTSSNPYISDDLLKGVSIGFDPPSVSSQLGTWDKALPSVISLPYGRNLPLHIQASSWRHVLKLLARLPGTTIQPTIEALAETKTEHKLRIVVQCVKPHLASTEWRVILWFTLEHPVPSNVPGSARYVNDVNVLPWTYTLSQPPQLLRGGPDSQLAKAYTIPVTSSLSFPKLPITFPDLAMYLHAALEVSRRHINDSSSGVRKLAKMIDFCYPNTNTDETAETERRGVGNLFKRVIGRANNNRKRGGNEDTYDLVTPFVADEWG